MCTQDTNEGPNPSGLCQCGCGQRTSLAQNSRPSRGDVKGKPVRYISGHGNRRYLPTDYIVDEKTGCWVWPGAASTGGYAHLRINGGVEYVHRWSFRQHKGEIPDGYEIDHLCRNRLCMNPEHLEAVPPVTNVRRSSNTKLTPEQVLEIRELSKSLSAREIAAQFGVHRITVHDIIHGRTWQDVG